MKIITENKRAYFDYQILQAFEAGIVLKGFEVKAVKSGRANIAGSLAVPKATFHGSELWLINADIPPYQAGNTPADYNPKRDRRLLLKKEEIKSIAGSLTNKSLKLVPLKIYVKNNLVKLELGLARLKKKQDKRAAITERQTKKELRSRKNEI